MDQYDPPFDWQTFPEGRARFSGEVRGIDERGHETFAVEIGGEQDFGELRRAFRANGNDYDIEVVAFGYGSARDVGMPMSACRAYPPAQVEVVARLVTQLVAAGATFADPPSVLKQYPTARFMGDVTFRDGWVLAEAAEAVS